ncbi:protein translocase subunit SecF [Candidatus Gracilibacteria bacterium]|nr:protein translocase subunit SecF [Candidatus Gracilibacteria bacterium]
MFSFTKNRYVFYSVALGLLVLSLLLPFFTQLNLGIDLTGGIQVEYTVEKGDVAALLLKKEAIIQKAKDALDTELKAIITDTPAYRISGTDMFVVEAGIDENTAVTDAGKKDLALIERAKREFVTNLEKEFASESGYTINQSRYVNIGASFGAYIKQSGYLTLTLAIIAIALYIQYAFRGSIAGMASWPFAVVTGVSLFHDVVIAFGLYVFTGLIFPEFKIDTFFITAMLTVLGYSINDTIVVMDRIRSNLHESSSKKETLSALIDRSIHDTMRRSIFTSLTILIVLVAVFYFGPDSLAGFSLALIFGTIVGAYSSIFIASPLLLDITGKK